MIIDHAYCLHGRVHGGRADEHETALLQRLA
jgi:hypothetical protein